MKKYMTIIDAEKMSYVDEYYYYSLIETNTKLFDSVEEAKNYLQKAMEKKSEYIFAKIKLEDNEGLEAKEFELTKEYMQKKAYSYCYESDPAEQFLQKFVEGYGLHLDIMYKKGLIKTICKNPPRKQDYYEYLGTYYFYVIEVDCDKGDSN